MPLSKKTWWLLGSWFAFLAFYAAISRILGPGHRLAAFGDVAQCIVPLFANAGLLVNAGTPHWRRNLFWMLIALSCTLWMIGQFEWTYYEVYLRRQFPAMYPGDVLFFLRGIPMMAALALQPDRRSRELHARLGYLDFTLLMTWWTFIYVFVVLPWLYAAPSAAEYNHNYNLVTNIQNTVIVVALIVFWLRSKGAWKRSTPIS